MSHPTTPRRVLRGPHGSVAVAKPGRFTIVADDGDHRGYGTEWTLADLQADGWRDLVSGEVSRG